MTTFSSRVDRLERHRAPDPGDPFGLDSWSDEQLLIGLLDICRLELDAPDMPAAERARVEAKIAGIEDRIRKTAKVWADPRYEAHRLFHLRRARRVDRSGQHPVPFETAQGLCQHLLRDSPGIPLDIVEAARPIPPHVSRSRIILCLSREAEVEWAVEADEQGSYRVRSAPKGRRPILLQQGFDAVGGSSAAAARRSTNRLRSLR